MSFVHSVVCVTTGPKPLPKRALHIVRSRASSFKWAYPLLSLRSSSSFLRLLPRLPVTSILPFIFPSITCCGRQFLHKMLPIKLAFRLLISWGRTSRKKRVFSIVKSNQISVRRYSGKVLYFVTLTKIKLCWKFKKAFMYFRGNLSIGSWVFPRGQTEVWAGMTEIIVTSRNCIANSPKILMILWMY
jgi:hypothetical protein